MSAFDAIQVKLISHWGGDRNVAEAAWASSTDFEALEDKSDVDVSRLVKTIVDLEHDTPKERVWLDFFIRCPIFVERQYDKYRMTVQHQGFVLEYESTPFGRLGITQNELSGRYRTIPERPYGMPHDVAAIIGKALKNNFKADDEGFLADDAAREFGKYLVQQHAYYNSQLVTLRSAERAGAITNAEYKRAREVLRGVLGTAFLTDMRVVMNLNAFEHIVNQRLALDAQLESRVVAARMVDALLYNNVARSTVNRMIDKHGWFELMQDVEVKTKRTAETVDEDDGHVD